MMKFIPALALVSASALGSSAAHAGDGAWRVGNDQVHIIDHAINVSTPEGRDRLLARVTQAAEKLCENLQGPERDECKDEAIRSTAKTQSTWGQALRVALHDRDSSRMAVR